MSEQGKKVAAIRPEDALETVYRDLVGIHYGLAEHGPTEPAETAAWAMRELQGVLDYIEAITTARPPAST